MIACSTFAVLTAQLYIGTDAARVAFRGAVVGYAMLIAWAAHQGLPVDWWSKVVDLGVFRVGGGLVAWAQAAREQRLTRLTRLFARLEDGDFSGA